MNYHAEGGFNSTRRKLLMIAGGVLLLFGANGQTNSVASFPMPVGTAADAAQPIPPLIRGVFPSTFFSSSIFPIGGQPYITNLVCRRGGLGTAVQFGIAGGTSNAIYDILIASALTALNATNSAWNWLAQGATGNTFTFYNQPDTHAYYTLAPAQNSIVIAWGDDSHGQCDVPPGLSNVVAVAGGFDFSLALKRDGTVIVWGGDGEGETNIPPGLTNVVAIAAGPYHALALRADGTVAAWGSWWNPMLLSLPMQLPSGLTNVTGIAAGAEHDIAVKADGTVIVWGHTNEPYDSVPTGLGGVIAVTAGWNHNVTLSANGSVTAWGYNDIGITDDLTTPPRDLTNAIAISAWALHTLALRRDTIVEAWGDDLDAQTNVPAGLSNVVAVATGEAHSLALKQDGTVAVWGDFSTGGPVSVPQGLMNAVSIGAGGNHCLAICAGLTTPVIVTEPQNQLQAAGGTATFTARGEDLQTVSYQWLFNGTNIPGATNATLTLSQVQATNEGNYQVVVSNHSGFITSSNAALILLTPPIIQSLSPPAGSTNFITNQFALSANATGPAPNFFPLHYQWFFNNVPINGATNSSYVIFPSYTAAWQTNPVNGNYSLQVSNAAGMTPSGTINLEYLSIPMPGMAVAWGSNTNGESDYPANLTNAKAITAGSTFSAALRENGTIITWGANNLGQLNVPLTLTNAIAIAAGDNHGLALNSTGSVAAWGDNTYGQSSVPAGLSNVVAMAAGGNLSMALLSSGTITNWGNIGAITNPVSLTNVTAIAVGEDFFMALRSNGTVTAWGSNAFGQLNVPSGLANVVAIAAGGEHALALKSDGTVTAWGDNAYGQSSVPPGLSNVMGVAAGYRHSVALKNDGTVVLWGDNSQGQTNVLPGLSYANVKQIAAGGYHTLALVFNPVMEYYPLNVRQDMLLIYNTNSADSATVLNFYLSNRPGVSNANVLGIGYTNWVFAPASATCGVVSGFFTNDLETISTTNITNQIIAPIQSWLAANPTKRPQYVVLFLDLPSRVVEPVWDYYPTCGFYPCCDATIPNHASVQVYINTSCAASWKPLVTSINMNGVNDCLGYIRKLAYFGTNYSLGQLVISASAGGYGDTNYYLDDSHGFESIGLYTMENLTNVGVPAVDIHYDPVSSTTALTNGAGVAGYFSWGTHGLLYPGFAVDGEVKFSGNSGWYLMTTGESFNGRRFEADQSTFMTWFAANAFGGTNYSNTPVGALGTVDEPGLGGIASPGAYCVTWSEGKNFAVCAWNARSSIFFQAVGDPFVQR